MQNGASSGHSHGHTSSSSNPWATAHPKPSYSSHGHSSYPSRVSDPWAAKPTYSKPTYTTQTSSHGHHAPDHYSSSGPKYGHYDVKPDYHLNYKVDKLAKDVTLLQSQSVVEDYFSVNQADITVDANIIVHLFDFCVDAGYVEVEVQMTLDTVVDDSVLSLMSPDGDGNGNVQIYAQSSQNDDTAPSSQSLIYRGELT